MRSINSLPIKNLVRKPARSLALIFISAFLALSAFGGTVMVMSLSNGINSLSARLGADIIVTPYAATSQVSYDSVIIQGKPGQFYMDSKYYEEIKTANASLTEQVAQLQSQIQPFAEQVKTKDALIEELTGKVHTYETASVKTRIALEMGLPYQMANRLNGNTEEEIKADAEGLKALVNAQVQPAPLGNPETGTKAAIGTSPWAAVAAQLHSAE